PYSALAAALLTTLGIDPVAFQERYADPQYYPSFGVEARGLFRKETFGEDRLVNHSPHIGDRHGMTDHPRARAGERFEEMLPALAHLADAAGAPPHMGLGVDEGIGGRAGFRSAIHSAARRSM